MRNLSSLFYGFDRLERELRRTGALDEPPQECPWLKSASLNELVQLTKAGSTLTELAGGTALIDAEFAEQVKARIDARARLGLPAVDCVGVVESEPRVELEGRPVPLKLAYESNPRSERPRLWRDVDGRRRMVSCDCLSDALDAAGVLSPASDKAVLRDAKRRHKAFAKEAAKQEAERPKPAPPPPRAAPVTPEPAPIPKPVAAAKPRERVTETPTRPFKVIHRRKRWYDADPPRPSDFRDMTF